MTTGAPMRWGRSRVLHSLSGAVSRAFTFVVLAVVLLSFTVAALHPEMTVLEPALSLLLMAAALALHVVVHEAAHSVTALALRMGVPEVQLGQGTPLLRFRLGSTAVKVGGFHSGVTHIEPQSTVLLRTRLALVTAAGPVSNLALAGLAYWLVDPPARGPGSFAYAVVAAGVVLGGFNLLPVKADTPRGKAETDGRALLSLLGADRRMGEQLVAASRLGAAPATARCW